MSVATKAASRRPISIWLLLALAWGLAALFGLGVCKHLIDAVTAASLKSVANAGVLALIAAYLSCLALAIQRRQAKAARLLGTVFLVLMALLVVCGPGEPSAECMPSPGCVDGWWIGRLTIAFIAIAWALAAGWSRSAKQYYAEAATGLS